MRAGENRDCGVCDPIPDQVWKAVENGAPDIAIQNGIDKRRFSKNADGSAELGME